MNIWKWFRGHGSREVEEGDPPPVQDGDTALDSPADAPVAERRVAASVGGGFFVLLLGWAILTPLDSGAVATGNIAVSGNKQDVQHSQGGIISSIAVTEGKLVQKGDVLLSINASNVEAVERGIAGEVYGLFAERERLIAERDGLPGVRIPIEFRDLKEGDAELANTALRTQERLFSARKESLFSRQNVLGQRSNQNSEQIVGLRRELEANIEQRRLIDEELQALKELEERGFASKSRVRAVERAAAELEGRNGSIKAQIASASEAKGEHRMQSVTMRREVIEEASQGLRDINIRLSELLPRLNAVREELDRTKVRAPETGRVVGLRVFTVGGVVGPGDVLMQIVPVDRELVIDAKVNPNDADDVKAEMVAQIRFPALQERNLPVLEGLVTKISADRLTDERTGIDYFDAEIRVPPSQMKILDNLREGENPLKPGLPAEVVIPLRKRTVFEYLTEPLTQMLWLAGREE